RPYETRLERRSVKPITPPSSQRGAQAPLRRSESGGARPSYRRPTPTPFATRRIEFGEVAARGSGGSTQEAGGVEGGVGEDDVGAGPSEADQALEQARVVVEVATLGGELEHGVLAAHLIRGDGEARAPAHEANDVGVREARLHEQHVGAFGLVERDLAEALARVRGINLIGLLVTAARGGVERLAKRAVEGRGVLDGVAADPDPRVAGFVERLADEAD